MSAALPLDELSDLLNRSPDLVRRVLSAEGGAAADILADAAEASGVQVDRALLAGYFSWSAQSGAGALSDRQLDEVAGGGASPVTLMLAVPDDGQLRNICGGGAAA